MLLSPDQQRRFWREWLQACRAQKWVPNNAALAKTPAEIDAARYALLARAGFTSLTLVDRTTGFTAVLKELATLRDDLSGMVRAEDNPRRVALHIIRAFGFARLYIMAICRDRFGLARSTDDEPWDNLPLEQLEQLRNTLANRARQKKGKSGKDAFHSVPNSIPVAEENPF